MMERWGVHPEEMTNEEEYFVEEVEPQGEVDLVGLFKSVVEVISKPQSEVPTYDVSLNVEELIDWIKTLDKYFEYEEVDQAKKVKFAMTNLRGHASIW